MEHAEKNIQKMHTIQNCDHKENRSMRVAVVLPQQCGLIDDLTHCKSQRMLQLLAVPLKTSLHPT